MIFVALMVTFYCLSRLATLRLEAQGKGFLYRNFVGWVIGADVLFVITGQRTVTALAPDEAALLDNYRNATPNNRAVLRKVGAALEKQIDDGEMCA